MAPRKKKSSAITLANAEEVQASLAPQREEAEKVLLAIQKLDLTTQPNRDKAGTLIVKFRERVAELEEQRKSLTAPILEAKRGIDNFFKPVRELFESCDKALTSRLLEATAAAHTEHRKALEAVAAGGGDAPSAVLAQAHATPLTPEGLREQSSWSFRVVDLSLVPNEYWVLNEGLVAVTVRKFKGDTQIPGIEVFEVKSFARSNSNG
jgi:hypothetical protein